MANQTSKRLLALVLAICLSLGLLLPAGQANATGSAGILTEVTGQEREQLSSLVDGTLAMEEQQEELPAADTPVRVFIVLSKAPWSRAMPPLPWRRRPPTPAVS